MAEVSPLGRAARLWVTWVAVSVALIGLGFGLARLTHSPWRDALANAEARPLAVATAETVAFRASVPAFSGTVRLGATTDVVVAPVGDAAVAVLTRQVVEPGDVVTAGMSVAEVSGRPVIALDLPFPLYRDLRPGDEGDDVVALQEALTRLGRYGGRIDGKLGPRTSDAIEALYLSVGKAPPVDADAEEALEDAQRAREDAVRVSAADGGSPDAADDRMLAEAVARARTGLPRAEVLRVGAAPLDVVSAAPTGTVLADGAPAVRLRASGPTVEVRITVDAVDQFAPGTQVLVLGTGGGTELVGTVQHLGEFDPGSPDGGTEDVKPGYPAVVQLAADAAVAEGWTVTVEPSGTPADVESLAVPLTAVREADGQLWVHVLSEGAAADARAGDTQARAVEIGMQQDGLVELVAGDVHVGDVVVVGGLE